MTGDPRPPGAPAPGAPASGPGAPASGPAAPDLRDDLPAELAVGLGIVSDVTLALGASPAPEDLNPVLLDACGVRVHRIGHLEDTPVAPDWGPLLALVAPGQELVWLAETGRRAGRPEVRLHLILRFNEPTVTDPLTLERRRRRFEALVHQWERHAFPDSHLEPLDPAELHALLGPLRTERPAARVITGLPADRGASPNGAGDDDARRPSLNDVLDARLDGGPLRIAFVLRRADAGEIEAERARWAGLRDAVHPLVKRQVGASGSTARTAGTTESTTQTDGAAQQEKDWIVGSVGRFLQNAWHGLRPGEDAAAKARWERAPANRNWSAAKGTTANTSTSDTEGWSDTGERVRTTLQHLGESFERQAQMLYAARAVGGWRALALVQGDALDVDVAADALLGALSGPRSADLPLRSFPVHGNADVLLRSTRPIVDAFAPAVPVLATDAAARLLLLPDGELPGVQLHRTAFGGRNNAPAHDGGGGERLRLGHGGLPGAGEVYVPMGDIWRHVLVAGTTGSGKTLRVLKLLEELHQAGRGVRVLVLETAKRTYRDHLRRPGQPPPRIYTLGDASGRALRINPFYFEPGTSLKRHLAVLAGALGELLPTEALVGPYLRAAVERCYEAHGWDIESGAHLGEGPPAWPSVLDFVEEVQRVADGLRYGDEVGANYRGALEGRARIFLDPTYQDLFSHDGDQDLDALFPGDAIVEYEQLPPGELDVPAFLTSLLLERIRARQVLRAARGGAHGGDPDEGWIVVVEEAHNVLPRELEGRGGAGESAGGRTLVRNVERLLQEGRSLRIGVVVVDQSPGRLARAVLQNTNTKVVLRLEDGQEIEEMGRTLGLDATRAAHLGLLQPGEAVVKAGFMANPVRSGPWLASELPPRRTEPHFEPGAGPPSYLRLTRAWAAVLAGDLPAALCADLVAAARGSAELAGFVLRRVALEQAGGHPTRREELFPGIPGAAAVRAGGIDVLVAWAETWTVASRAALATAALAPAPADRAPAAPLAPAALAAALAPLERRLLRATLGRHGGETEPVPAEALAAAEQWLGPASLPLVRALATGPVDAPAIAALRALTRPGERLAPLARLRAAAALASGGSLPERLRHPVAMDILLGIAAELATPWLPEAIDDPTRAAVRRAAGATLLLLVGQVRGPGAARALAPELTAALDAPDRAGGAGPPRA